MPWPELLVLVSLILLNAFLVAAELAIVSSRPARLQKFVSDGKKGAVAATALNADPGRFLPAVQIGITFVAIISGAYGEQALAPSFTTALEEVGWFGAWSGWVASIIVVVVISYFSLVIGELVPKRLALSNREVIACFVAPTMNVWATISTPISYFLRISTDAVLRLAGPMKAEPEITEEEVKSMIAEGTEAGVFEKAEQEIIERVLSVADRSVRSIMVPRRDIIWLDVNDGEDAIFNDIFASGHSRFPVCRSDVDETLGVIHAKTLLEQCRHGGKINLEAAIMAPLYVHESTNVLKLLEMFKNTLVHMAIVLDEHGTVQGIVTPADILAGIAGELPEEEADIGQSAVQREDGSWLLDAQMPVYEVERVLDVHGMAVDDAEYTTLAGFVLAQLGHIPAVGEKFRWRSWVFEVIDLDGRRIDKVLAFRPV
ncbi:hemolysin family protein [Rhodomicrobium lacus]|uniref:hemolysin family protein n=1 Tax=Rhodomicrobium lacus TaxID=2498452 RepID=UPI000F8E306E|nr:hemolysin family protein [Rhodomicrobium lacus]WKW51676.1 hemolysin family protein [Rhodomicrobium lacus]